MQFWQIVLTASQCIEYVEIAEDGVIMTANPAFDRHVSDGNAAGHQLFEYMPDSDAQRVRDWIAGGPPNEPVLLNFRDVNSFPYTLRCVIGKEGKNLRLAGEPDRRSEDSSARDMVELNNEMAVLSREHARRSKELAAARDQLAAALSELQNSYWHLRRLQEVMPVCMECGKLKTDTHSWQSVSEYFRAHEIFLSHGYCPACLKRVEREYDLEMEEE